MRRDGFIRNFVFGAEDSLVSTVGVISGVATAGVARETLVLAGLVIVVVEAFSMAMGTFVADETVREYEKHAAVRLRPSVNGGIVMLVSYLGAGLLVLGPYFFISSSLAIPLSILLSLSALFILGVVNARMAHLPVFQRGCRMLVTGGLAIAIGAFVANAFGPKIIQ